MNGWSRSNGQMVPKETRDYVQIVTGHSAEEWSGGTTQANLALPERMPCRDAAKSIDYRIAVKSNTDLAKVSASNAPQAPPGWGVQLVGSPSQASAVASFQQLQRAYKRLLEARQLLVIQSKVGTSGFWYRVRVATDSRSEAEKLCSDRRTAGASCLVQRN